MDDTNLSKVTESCLVSTKNSQQILKVVDKDRLYDKKNEEGIIWNIVLN